MGRIDSNREHALHLRLGVVAGWWRSTDLRGSHAKQRTLLLLHRLDQVQAD